jgi:tetratricopeptide (TPR) repeat protein
VKIVVLGLSQLAGLPILLLIFVPAIYYWRKASKEKKDRIELTEKRLPSLFPNKAEQEPVAGHERVPTKQWLGRYLTFAYVLIVYALMFTAAITGHFFLGILAYDLMIYTISQAVLLFKSKSEPLVYRHVLTMMLLCLLIFVATAIPGTFISEAIGQAMGFDRVAYSIIMLACAFVLTLWQILAIQRADFYFSNNYLRSPLKKGDFQEGLKLSEALLKQNPGHPDLLFLKGWIFYQLGQAEAAEKIYRELIENAKKSPPEFIAPCLINLSAALQLQGKYDEALPFLEAAVKIRPEYVTAYREMALWYLEQNLFPERALEMTEVMLHFDKKPRSNFLGQRFMWAWNHAAHALALAKTGQREDALSFMQQAVEGNDNHDFVAKWSILLSKADIHRALGDKVEAKAIYQQILAIEPRFVVHQYAEKGLAQLDASIA